jgi:hypothetical protein
MVYFLRTHRRRARQDGRGRLHEKSLALGAAAREGRQAPRDAVPSHIEENSTTYLDSVGLRSIPKGPLFRAGPAHPHACKGSFPVAEVLEFCTKWPERVESRHSHQISARATWSFRRRWHPRCLMLDFGTRRSAPTHRTPVPESRGMSARYEFFIPSVTSLTPLD